LVTLLLVGWPEFGDAGKRKFQNFHFFILKISSFFFLIHFSFLFFIFPLSFFFSFPNHSSDLCIIVLYQPSFFLKKNLYLATTPALRVFCES